MELIDFLNTLYAVLILKGCDYYGNSLLGYIEGEKQYYELMIDISGRKLEELRG